MQSSHTASSSPTPTCSRRSGPRARPTDDALLRRQLDVLHDAFVGNQVGAELRREIVELETRVASTFNNFRGAIDGTRVDDNDIAEILRASDDGASAPSSLGGRQGHRPGGRRRRP